MGIWRGNLKGSLEGTLGLGRGKCMETEGLEEEFARAGPLQRVGFGARWDGGPAGVGPAGVRSEGKRRERL